MLEAGLALALFLGPPNVQLLPIGKLLAAEGLHSIMGCVWLLEVDETKAPGSAVLVLQHEQPTSDAGEDFDLLAAVHQEPVNEA